MLDRTDIERRMGILPVSRSGGSVGLAPLDTAAAARAAAIAERSARKARPAASRVRGGSATQPYDDFKVGYDPPLTRRRSSRERFGKRTQASPGAACQGQASSPKDGGGMGVPPVSLTTPIHGPEAHATLLAVSDDFKSNTITLNYDDNGNLTGE